MTIKKTKLGLVAVFLCAINVAHATAAGPYIGIQAGMSNTNNKSITFPTGLASPATVNTSPSNTGLGFRIYAGGNLNKYFGIETGLARYANATYSPNSTVISGKPAIHEAAWDIVGKGMLPLEAFTVFVKGGIALMYTSTSNSIVEAAGPNPSGVSTGNSTSAHPTLAIGGSYDLTQNWVAELTASRVFGNTGVQSADLVTLGITYHFVDEYCGQFLC